MQVEIGKIYEGTVKNITKYGAFVEIPNPDGDKIMGMVHISEVSRSYVNEIRDFVTENSTDSAVAETTESAAADRPVETAMHPTDSSPVRHAAASPMSGSRKSGRNPQR